MLFNKPCLVVAAAALATFTANASAQTTTHRHHPRVVERHHHPHVAVQYIDERPPLTVNRRSFLDPGPVVPVGSMSSYMTENTFFNRTPDQYFLKSEFGNEVRPQPLEVPGRAEPIIEWETPGYPY